MSVPAFDMVLFGGTGDLARRKLIPALFDAHQGGELHPRGRIFAIGTQPLETTGYLALLERDVRPTMRLYSGAPVSDDAWASFVARIVYQQVDARKPEQFDALAAALGEDRAPVTVCYLATAPGIFVDICAQLARVGLNAPNVRLVLEKPLGIDLASNERINSAVAEFFAEDQIYRIDHYLGKESVQNLMAIRFGNALFEPLWRREWIKDVQITIAEQLGVEKRGDFYDGVGALRDMVQNHLLQLVCIVAMEPPASLSQDAIRDEKLKILKALKPIPLQEVPEKTVRGQYLEGAIAGQPVQGYLSEHGIPHDSRTETFVAIRAEIANWRWAGVPFYLRTGKRMPQRLAEIVVRFHDVPHALFPKPLIQFPENRLVIRLQPEESIRLQFLTKTPGATLGLQPSTLDLDFTDHGGVRHAGAYERLLMDAVNGQLGLFVRRDEQAEAWRWVEPIIEAWNQARMPPKGYTAGSWGPAASSALLSRDAAAWHEEM